MNEMLEGFLTNLLHVIASTVFLAVMLGINLSWDVYWLIFYDKPNFISSAVILFITFVAISYFCIVWFLTIGSVLLRFYQIYNQEEVT